MNKRFFICLSLLLVAVNSHAQALFAGEPGQKPLEVALVFLQDKLPDGHAEGREITTIRQERLPCKDGADCLPQIEISFVIDGIADDSVRAIQRILILEQKPGQPWLIVNEDINHACRDGRGHTDFSKEPCL